MLAENEKSAPPRHGTLPRALQATRLNTDCATTCATGESCCRMEPMGIEPTTSALRTQRICLQGVVVICTYGAGTVGGCRWGRAGLVALGWFGS